MNDYTRRSGVEFTEILAPDHAPDWARDRDAVWNAAEAANTRKNSTVSREFKIAFPASLDFDNRRELVREFSRGLVAKHGCVVDFAMHLPDEKGDQRNYHAHVLMSTHRMGPDGFTEKTRELDARGTGSAITVEHRKSWAEQCAMALTRAGRVVDAERWRHGHLTKEEQVDKARERGDLAFVRENEGFAPTSHIGPAATGYERRTGEPSRRRLDSQNEITERLTAAKAQGDLERQKEQAHRRIIELSEDLHKAKAVAKQDRELQTKLTRLEGTLELSEKAGIPITGTERSWLDRDRKELATFRAEHGITGPATDKPGLGQLTKLDTPEERLRAAREAGEKERQQPGDQVERSRGPEEAQERLRAAREAGEREREEDKERPRTRPMRER